MFNAAVGRASLGGFVLVILSASLAEADFGPRTTIGQNYQQSSSTTSQNGINAGSCNGFNNCFILFQPIPQQKPLIVQHVSCRMSISTTAMLFAELRTRKGQSFPQKRTALVPVNTTGSFWVVNSPAMHLLKSGERPDIRLVNNSPAEWSDLECSISGKLQQP